MPLPKKRSRGCETRKIEVKKQNTQQTPPNRSEKNDIAENRQNNRERQENQY